MALKVGMVGFNGIAKPHANAYSTDDLAELVAICDVVKERADSGAAAHNCKAYYSLADMLDAHPDLDLVDVATGGYENGSWHYEPAMEAMAAGKNVLVEKPISSDVGEAREMVAMAARQDVYLACNLNHYFTPVAARGKQYMTDGQVGELVYCLMKMGFQGGEPEHYSAPGSPKMKDFPYFHLKAFLTHPFSVMRYFGGDVTHVQAFLSQPGFRRSAGDPQLSTASIHLRFANGAAGYLLSQRGDTSYGLGGWWSCEVAGTKGTFVLENCIEKVTYWRNPRAGGSLGSGADAGEVTLSGETDFGKTFAARLHALLEDIGNQVPKDKLRGSGYDALAVLEYTFAVIDSYEQGGVLVRPHPLPTRHGDPRTMLG
jgi:predicted dehydrogenase